MESDEDDDILKSKPSDKVDGKDLNISHEDLSDVSDLDSMSQDTLEREVPQVTRLIIASLFSFINMEMGIPTTSVQYVVSKTINKSYNNAHTLITHQ